MATNPFYTKEQALSILEERFKGLDWQNPADQQKMRNIIREVLAKTSVEVGGKTGKTTFFMPVMLTTNLPVILPHKLCLILTRVFSIKQMLLPCLMRRVLTKGSKIFWHNL